MSGRCYRFYGGVVDPDRIRLYRIAVMAAVVSAAVTTLVVLGTMTNWYIGAAVLMLVLGPLPAPVYVACSHVRVEPDRLVIVRDYGFLRREEEIPRRLIKGAEVVTAEVGGGLEGKRRIRVVRVYLRDRGCMPMVVKRAEELARELGSHS
ncbi:MAG: hypothetical protein ABGY09_05640 [Euryarchaeota archaeon]